MVFLWQDLAAEERVVAAWEPRPALGAPVGLSRWKKCGSISLILCHRPSTMSFESAEYPLAASPLGPPGHSSLQKNSGPWRGCASGEPACYDFLPNCTGLEPSERRLPYFRRPVAA
jgi:hypothetical protein